VLLTLSARINLIVIRVSYVVDKAMSLSIEMPSSYRFIGYLGVQSVLPPR
jgi:hypothetical protein